MTTTWLTKPKMTDAVKQDGLRVLIVEDNDDSALSLALVLRLYGHHVSIAKNGTQAIVAVRGEKPDVLLLDLGLPGMSGYDVARQIYEDRPNQTPFLIAMTGFGQEEDRRHSFEAGIDLHLVKPVNPSDLESLLRRFQKIVQPSTEPSSAKFNADARYDGLGQHGHDSLAHG